ncbi:sensory rhodopsin transducer [Tengunoibacter tsumagoiensis]|uniref:Uncharacterized protein n=1 Tax=Tengunoibacter tsumagoiensis TaxID=2014871 RepID=A0A402A9R0_9CHLR|nr:sensory rhodopsin transducer [Tengunoibacter tsumagoiensis]GCE15746.1 hypothetical protein KTT_56050 [Tengunoibacter tsumagoiensis]
MERTYSYYCSEGILFDFCQGKRLEGRLLNSAATLSLFNPHIEKKARVLLTFYFIDLEPVQKDPFFLEPEQLRQIHLHEPLMLLHNTHYALKVEADLPLVTQHTTSDFSPFAQIPNDMETVALYSGPLGTRETAWYFADTWMGSNDQRSWFEYETLSISNPNQEAADIRLKFFGSHATGEKVTFERETHLKIPAERMIAVRLWELPETQFKGSIASNGIHDKSADFSTWLRSSIPVVAQKTRRAYKQFDTAIHGVWTVIGTPCGGSDSTFSGGQDA